MATVTIYSTPTCGFCHQLKDWLSEKKVPFTDKDITTDGQAFQEAMDKAGQPVVPITDIDGTIIVGFDRPAIQDRLKEAGLLSDDTAKTA